MDGVAVTNEWDISKSGTEVDLHREEERENVTRGTMVQIQGFANVFIENTSR